MYEIKAKKINKWIVSYYGDNRDSYNTIIYPAVSKAEVKRQLVMTGACKMSDIINITKA